MILTYPFHYQRHPQSLKQSTRLEKRPISHIHIIVSTRRTRILMGFIIGYLVLAVNPVGRYIFKILLFNIDMRDVTESLYVLCFILRRSYRHDMMLYDMIKTHHVDIISSHMIYFLCDMTHMFYRYVRYYYSIVSTSRIFTTTFEAKCHHTSNSTSYITFSKSLTSSGTPPSPPPFLPPP